MRVCIFGRADYGQLKSRTQQLAAHGVDLHILSLQTGEMNHATVHTVSRRQHLGGFAFFTLPWSARRLLRRLQPDVIDIHGVSSYGAYCFGPLPGVPICATVYGSDVTAHAATSRAGRFIAKRCLTSANLIYASSVVANDDIRRVLNMDCSDRFVSRSWGIEMDSIKSLGRVERISQRAELGIPEDGVIAVHNRQFRDFWRVDGLLEVAIQFCQTRAHYFLFVCPPGDAIAHEKSRRAEAKVVAEGLGDQIRFLRSIDHEKMLKVFNAADIFVCFGDADLLSSSVLEALALGLTPILRKLPAYEEVVRDGFNGYFHDELVESELVDQMLMVAKSLPQHREKFGDPNRRLIAASYDAKECSRWMVDRYYDLADRRTSPAWKSAEF